MEKLALVTGSTDGLGRGAAKLLAGQGWHVVVHGRDPRKVADALADVRKAAKAAKGSAGEITSVTADLSRLEEVHALADVMLRTHGRLDALVNNAGVATPNLSARTRRVTADGYQLEWQVNFLAAFALTLRLTGLLVASAPARVVNVSSVAQGWGAIHWDDLQLERHWDRMAAYAQSKLALTAFTNEYAQRLHGRQVYANSLHPGMCSTKMVRSTFVFAPHRTRYGAENIARLVTDPGLRSTSGAYFNERRRIEPNAFAHDPAGRRRLWDVALAQSRVADHAETVLPELLTV
ncbi:SDR family NAD(P)-dependent oxidoreductase [Streptomyces sp. NPDC047085]|uniref:SDR family NAD(P)-dependent oxidoreductase n=1 Tax=Streptomyces sp. NPDC047085 TaxID=3155140 RepID=UPI0033C815E0